MAEEGNEVEMITGRIYIIRSPNTDMVYIGSTTMSLKRRFGMHLYDWKNQKKRRTNSYLVLEKGDANIELLQEVLVENDKELKITEQFWIDRTLNTVNKIKAYLSEDEKVDYQKIYRETHKEDHLEFAKKYYETHKVKILKQRKKRKRKDSL